jgi:hypothetical protein
MLSNEQGINICMNGYDGSITDFINAQEEIGFNYNAEAMSFIDSTSIANSLSLIDSNNYNKLDEAISFLNRLYG